MHKSKNWPILTILECETDLQSFNGLVTLIGSYNLDLFTNYLCENQTKVQCDVLVEMSKCNINGAIIKLDTHVMLSRGHKEEENRDGQLWPTNSDGESK